MHVFTVKHADMLEALNATCTHYTLYTKQDNFVVQTTYPYVKAQNPAYVYKTTQGCWSPSICYLNYDKASKHFIGEVWEQHLDKTWDEH